MKKNRSYDEPIMRMDQFDGNESKLSLRRQWMNRARAQFKPGKSKPCHICDDYEEITQAHHIYPLALQYTRGVPAPIHECAWLCPNHHKIVHQRIKCVLCEIKPKKDANPEQEELMCEIDARLLILHPID